ncbi:dTDP-4-dehydrorhamnose reductase [Ciceribacter ferrooxidans]|uniref:dTDP-4-dehydrorhamnose reductase n=1 Tax=Ciceribacter ferrooxidans TaxID=2509717 RepID=A0A4Q2T7D2_9HYPH|nr:dTDP-4-dehydrorhamnose reductase [Ciceribacter ferrooxidans]RYC13951.1 dTDP-4-dehydrorhamnose reductase [Ciceribacter ferrooxidans]
MRILITGVTGQVGHALCRYDWPEDAEIVAASRHDLDLAETESIASYISAGRFDAVINPAAYTAVDRAETDLVAAWRVNALAPAAMAAATWKVGIPLICVSTDYVFDGTKAGAYNEDAPISPSGVYGASKAAGELAVRTGNPRHVILRTSWVFSAHGANFVKTMLRLAEERPRLRVVDDQRGCPTSARDIAAVLAKITLRLIADPQAPTGTYHFSNAEPTTWCDFAKEIFRQTEPFGYPVPDVEAIATTEYPTPARRPANSVLETTKIERDFAVVPRPWREALAEVLSDLAHGVTEESEVTR